MPQESRRPGVLIAAASGFRVLCVSVQFPPVGEHPKLRPRILRATESPECPPLVEIAEVDRLNPKTLVISYTDGTTCTYSVEQLRSLEPIRSNLPECDFTGISGLLLDSGSPNSAMLARWS
jgi:hypothetical protein